MISAGKIEINDKYLEVYYRTIIHLQHFFELSVKQVLRSVDEILPLDRNQGVDLLTLCKLRMGKEVAAESLDKLKTVEFAEALRRFKNLIEDKDIELPFSREMLQHQKSLEKLNELRNRVWHRGTYVLQFSEFVRFVGQYMLPIIPKMIAALGRDDDNEKWEYKPLKSKVDPINLLIDVCTNRTLKGQTLWEVFSILELGRAAYQNPLPKIAVTNPFWEYFSARHENRAREWVGNNSNIALEVCPVCGLQSLTVETEFGNEIGPDGQEHGFLEALEVICHCCSYEVKTPETDPAVYGYCEPFLRLK